MISLVSGEHPHSVDQGACFQYVTGYLIFTRFKMLVYQVSLTEIFQLLETQHLVYSSKGQSRLLRFLRTAVE